MRMWERFPELTRAVAQAHKEVGLVASGHDMDHDLEVAELALVVAWDHDESAAVLAGVAGLLHSMDRILERRLSLSQETISTVPEEVVREVLCEMLHQYVCIDAADRDRVIGAVIHHGSKPNREGDDLVTIALADADRLANMGATLPIRSGQHHSRVRILNPVTIQVDYSERHPREKYNHPDSVLWDIQNAVNWYRQSDGLYALRLPKALEIGKIRAERLERLIEDILAERALVGLYPYPTSLL